MSDYIKVYRFKTSGNLLLETDPGYRHDDPKIEEAYSVLKELPDDCDLARLIKSATKAETEISGKLGDELSWGYVGAISESSGGRTGVTGAEVFRPKLQSLRKVARKLGRWEGDECSFESRAAVLNWLNTLIKWAELNVVPKKKRTGRPKKEESDNATRIKTALTKHHQYENGRVGNYDAGSLPQIAVLAGFPKSNKKAVGDFLQKRFGGYAEYVDECRKKNISLKLAEWNEEIVSRLPSLRDEDGVIRDPSDDD